MNPLSKAPRRASRMGVGVRVISGERTGYAYSDDLSPGEDQKAARVAALHRVGAR